MGYFSKIMATAYRRVDKTRERLEALVSEFLVRKRARPVPCRHTSALQRQQCASDLPFSLSRDGQRRTGKWGQGPELFKGEEKYYILDLYFLLRLNPN